MSGQKLMRFFLLVILIAAISAAGYFYLQVRVLKQNPQAIAQKEADELIEKISKLMVLPENEIPTIATVSDPELLKDQPFFASAKRGDKVLIYAQAKKAILYSVSLNKIINVAPLNIGAGETITPPTLPIEETEETTTSEPVLTE